MSQFFITHPIPGYVLQRNPRIKRNLILSSTTIHRSTISIINENGTQTRHSFAKAWHNSAIFKCAELHPNARGRIRSAEMFNGVSPSGKAIMRIHKKFLAKFLNLPPADRHTTTEDEGETGVTSVAKYLNANLPREVNVGRGKHRDALGGD